jgi:hypothetical protein
VVNRGRQVLVALGLVVLVFGVLAGVAQLLGPDEPAGGMVLEDLADIEQLRSRFNADSGVPRLVMVLSPT